MRSTERGKEITLNIQQTPSNFKRVNEYMTIETVTGIKRFQKEKGYGKWFDLLFPLVKSQNSCQPNLAIEPISINDHSEEVEIA